MDNLPKVLSFQQPKKQRYGIVAYGNVQSRSRSTKLIHNAVAQRFGSRIKFNCSCEDKLLNPRRNCIHIVAFAHRVDRDLRRKSC